MPSVVPDGVLNPGMLRDRPWWSWTLVLARLLLRRFHVLVKTSNRLFRTAYSAFQQGFTFRTFLQIRMSSLLATMDQVNSRRHLVELRKLMKDNNIGGYGEKALSPIHLNQS